MRERKQILELTDFEWRLFIACLNTARSIFLEEGKPIDDINMILVKAIKAKLKKVRI